MEKAYNKARDETISENMKIHPVRYIFSGADPKYIERDDKGIATYTNLCQ